MKKAIELLIICTALTVGLAGCMADTSLEDAAPAENAQLDETLANTVNVSPPATVSVEEEAYRLLKSLRTEERKYMDEILEFLPDINWSAYSKHSKEHSNDEYALEAMDLLRWLTYNPGSWQGDNMLKIFQARNGLDGALAEQYSVIVGSFFTRDKDKFVELLSQLDDGIESICGHVAYHCDYYMDLERLAETTAAYFADKQLSDSERFVVNSLIEAFEAYCIPNSP
jgi:hypothetical protein